MGRKPSLLLVSVFRLRERKGPTRRIQIYHLRGSATVTTKTHIEIKTMIEKGIAYERKARRPQVGLIQNRRRHRGPPLRIRSYAPYRREVAPDWRRASSASLLSHGSMVMNRVG
jgi:hypothetical protein